MFHLANATDQDVMAFLARPLGSADAACMRTQPPENIVGNPVDQREDNVDHRGHDDDIDGDVRAEGDDAGHGVGLDPGHNGHERDIDQAHDWLCQEHAADQAKQHQRRSHYERENHHVPVARFPYSVIAIGVNVGNREQRAGNHGLQCQHEPVHHRGHPRDERDHGDIGRKGDAKCE